MTETLKVRLANIFNDSLDGKKWNRRINYAILFFIVLSTFSIFLSTYESIRQQYGFWLNLIDYITLTIFTIEVSLRIWCIDLTDEKYRGLTGRIRYCFSFYGLMDILSTYTFFLAFIFPISATTVQILRVLRLCRIFRYLKSIQILSRAFKAKQDEMRVSLEFLVIITLILSFILYFVEHQAQPEVYNNGWTSVVWAFLQYIGDPGGFADTPPITTTGRFIASAIGILTLAIFAVPAGLVASAFSEIMQEDKEATEIAEFKSRILQSFRFNYDRHYTKLYYVPRYQPLSTILTRKYISETEIIKTVGKSDCFHLFNLANAISPAENPNDKIVVVNYKKNRPYGCCIDRKSKITIVSTSGFMEPVTSWFAYHIAKIGGFNFISKEVETNPDNPISYYLVNDEDECPNFSLFLEDLNQLSDRKGSWVFPILGSVATSERPTQIHFCYSPEKGDDSYDNANITIKNIEQFEKMYQAFSLEAEAQYQLKTDKNRYFNITSKNIARFIKTENSCTLRINTKLFVFDSKSIAYAKFIADIFNQYLEAEVPKDIPADMKLRNKNAFGLMGYNDEI
ncbi:ion transporter [Gallibacterium genomosp. 3]|uniref:ion transporter n=1 Tax=Gallibacterium genomosp. 3 TaxID=505345 RepID=UPI00080283DA|nr:ion transporter [Gallibacterium genomosp. 3]